MEITEELYSIAKTRGYVLSGCWDTAEDLAQSASLKLLSYNKEVTYPKGLIYTTVRNLWLNMLEKNRNISYAHEISDQRLGRSKRIQSSSMFDDGSCLPRVNIPTEEDNVDLVVDLDKMIRLLHDTKKTAMFNDVMSEIAGIHMGDSKYSTKPMNNTTRSKINRCRKFLQQKFPEYSKGQ